MVGRQMPRLVDIATGRHFGRFHKVTKSMIKQGFVNLEYHPSGIGGLGKPSIIRDIPEGGFVQIMPADDPNVCKEGVVYLLQGEGGISPVKDLILKDVEAINQTMLERVDILQAQLEKYKDIEKQASIGLHRQVKQHQKIEKMITKDTTKPLAEVRPRRPSPYERFGTRQDDDDEEIDI